MVCVAVKEGGDSALANDIAQDHPLTATPLERTNGKHYNNDNASVQLSCSLTLDLGFFL